jgi:hypothetical protein
MSKGFHTYGVDWQADYLTYYFDGNQVWKTPTPSDLNEPMYIIANLAVGGNWPGMVNGTTPFPAQMKIDYIHAYVDKGLAPPPPPPPAKAPPPPPSGGANPPTSGTSRDAIRGTRRDDTRDDRDGSDTTRDTRRHDTQDRKDGSDTIRDSRRDDTHDRRDGSDTIRGTRRDDTHDRRDGSDTMSGSDGNANYLADRSAGSDTFTFNKKAVVQGDNITHLTGGTDMAGHSVADEYLSFQSDGAGSTKVDFDPDAAGTAHQSPWLITALDTMQTTGVHTQTDWFLH